ncbi:MAG: DUF1460 domain-containing protein [Candidatus Sericytochromatia bacterium]|nr:DUF1460 domain-containing protein [Candidatus Tanganyikabacteria bacterium]
MTRIGIGLVLLAALGGVMDEPDRCILARRAAEAGRPSGQDAGAWLARVGMTFVGTPYVAGRLESAGPERLVCDLEALDCVTFVEVTLALATCLWRRDASLDEAFPRELARWRYRDGRVDGWSSRLHYASSWAAVHTGRAALSDVTVALGGTLQERSVSFMTEHPDRYPGLEIPANRAVLGDEERLLSARPEPCLPVRALAAPGLPLAAGDIILVLSDRPGLDVQHLGVAVRRGHGPLAFLHAPRPGRKVSVAPGTMAEYLAAGRDVRGVRVLRWLPPPVRGQI